MKINNLDYKKFTVQKYLTFLCATLLMLSNVATADQSLIRITGIPDENPTQLQRKYHPMIDYLEQQLGEKVQYVPVTDYGAAVAALSAGKVDFAWLGGFTHVQARILTGATPIVMRDIDRKFKSVFIANTRSKINLPNDLKGVSFAFGSKSSTSGHLMPRHFLLSSFDINPEKDFRGRPVFSGAHDATAKMVETGKVTAGALNAEVWKRLVKAKKIDLNKVKLIWTTPAYVDYVWTARKGLDDNIIRKFKIAFLSLTPSNKQHQLVLSLQGSNKYVEASDSDFDAIENVGRQVGLLK